MGPLGMQEMFFIVVLALVLFGPKKLPEIGRTLGKAITEFRRASAELKTTFEREMQSLEQETHEIKTIASQYQYDTYNYDYSSEAPYEGSYGTESHDSTAVVPSTLSASATEGAESTSAVPPEGVIARGEETAASETGVQQEADAALAESRDHVTPHFNPMDPGHPDAHDPTVSTTSDHA
jgi:sec-independent protein translocase protein TatA